MADSDPLSRADAARRATLERELEGLYVSHWDKLVRYFRHMGQAEGVAAELAQDSFVQALRALPQFRGDSKLSTWLWTIAHRVLLAQVRRVDPASPADEAPGDEVFCALMQGADAHLNARTQDLGDCVRRGFARFAAQEPERAQALLQAYVEGYTREELAEALGRSPHAATEYLSQCSRKLRPFIEHCREP